MGGRGAKSATAKKAVVKIGQQGTGFQIIGTGDTLDGRIYFPVNGSNKYKAFDHLGNDITYEMIEKILSKGKGRLLSEKEMGILKNARSEWLKNKPDYELSPQWHDRGEARKSIIRYRR